MSRCAPHGQPLPCAHCALTNLAKAALRQMIEAILRSPK